MSEEEDAELEFALALSLADPSPSDQIPKDEQLARELQTQEDAELARLLSAAENEPRFVPRDEGNVLPPQRGKKRSRDHRTRRRGGYVERYDEDDEDGEEYYPDEGVAHVLEEDVVVEEEEQPSLLSKVFRWAGMMSPQPPAPRQLNRYHHHSGVPSSFAPSPEPSMSYDEMLALDEGIERHQTVHESQLSSEYPWPDRGADALVVQCVFCLESIGTGDPVLTLPCLHHFHASELRQWIATGASKCPTCQAQID